MPSNVRELADVAKLLVDLEVNVWEVFFLITTGRGLDVTATSAQANEDVCHFLVDASRYGFTVRTVEAPFFRRVARERADGVKSRPVNDSDSFVRISPRPLGRVARGEFGARTRAERRHP